MIATAPNRQNGTSSIMTSSNELKQAYWKGYKDNGRISLVSLLVGVMVGVMFGFCARAIISWVF